MLPNPGVLVRVVRAEAEADLPSRYRDEIPDVLTVSRAPIRLPQCRCKPEFH
jgi:hypothetical protein